MLAIRINDIRLAVSILILYCVPQIVFVVLGTSSLAAGMLISGFLLIFLNYKYFRLLRLSDSERKVVFVVLAVIGGSALLSLVFSAETKPLLTFLSFPVLIATFFLVSSVFVSSSFQCLSRAFCWVFYFLIFFGWLDMLLPISVHNYSLLNKPVMPFSEESHYALALAPIACAHAIGKNWKYQLFIALNVIGQAILFPSFTMIVVGLFLVYVCWGVRSKVFSVFILLFVIALVVSFLSLEGASKLQEYFLSRLDFTTESSNLTALVFLQGWDDLVSSLSSTNGLGLGFQMLGKNEAGEVADVIFDKFGVYKNREDGSFLASKLVSEFGVLGVFVVLSFLIYFVRYIRSGGFPYLSKKLLSQIDDECKQKYLLLSTIVFVYFIELFLRGYGYFSPSFVFVMAAIVALRRYAIMLSSKLRWHRVM